jgi:hypothetical protein
MPSPSALNSLSASPERLFFCDPHPDGLDSVRVVIAFRSVRIFAAGHKVPLGASFSPGPTYQPSRPVGGAMREVVPNAGRLLSGFWPAEP